MIIIGQLIVMALVICFISAFLAYIFTLYLCKGRKRHRKIIFYKRYRKWDVWLYGVAGWTHLYTRAVATELEASKATTLYYASAGLCVLATILLISNITKHHLHIRAVQNAPPYNNPYKES